MKKLFTLEDYVIALVAALGYGFSFEIPQILGSPIWLCTVSCLVVGMALEFLERRLVFSRAAQKTQLRRYMTLIASLLVFLTVQYLAISQLGLDMLKYVVGQCEFATIIPLLIFVFSMGLRRYRIRKVRARYGDGEKGFLFDGLLKKAELDEFNQQNRPLHGAFDAKLAVKTRTGCFVGVKEKDSLFFVGIPYAQPPVGERRWKAPEPLPASDAVFEARYFGASAIQVDYDGSLLKHHRQGEDCLTLNICVDSRKRAGKKPVIVFFHHGDFSYGGSADPLLYGENFVKTYPDTVGVTFNYRLGIFGFIDFSGIPGGEAYPDAPNLGLLDQLAALRWIRENIAAFGGDPERITVAGFEAGAVSLTLLAASGQAKGLFQKAIIFHGSPLSADDTPEASRKLAKKLLQETSATSMEELLRLPAERLKEASQKLALDLSGPIRDGKLIPVDVYAACQKGAAYGIEFIIGIPSNERQIYKSFVGRQKYADSIDKNLASGVRYLEKVHPAGARELRAYIEEQAAVMPALEAKAMILEQLAALSTYSYAQNMAACGNKVHLFYWDVKPLIENLGSGTVDVMTVFLGNHEVAQVYGNVLNPDIAETLQKLFRKFVYGEEMQLFHNEIKGIGTIDWSEFPQALIVSGKAFQCRTLTDKLSEISLPEIKRLLGIMM